MHDYEADTFKDLTEKATGQLVFTKNFIRGEQIFFAKILLLHRPCHIINFALSLAHEMLYRGQLKYNQQRSRVKRCLTIDLPLLSKVMQLDIIRKSLGSRT